jgi:NADH-quinone oxidoreductase subunit G
MRSSASEIHENAIIKEIRNIMKTEKDGKKILTVNGREVCFDRERNLLEVIRKAGIELPTFCYHSELSIYGACRLCIVDIEGRGVQASCSTAPETGMVVRTETKEIRESRKISVELLLANHRRECPSCVRSAHCALQDLGRRLGVEEVRYKQRHDYLPLDTSSPSLTRDPNKCVLCGDCVRVCREIQGIGAIDFANRGAAAKVVPAFGNDLGMVECVNCGQCAAVCPTGAIIPRQNREQVWDAIHDRNRTVVVQVAPAVRVALGEQFGFEAGTNVAGKLATALRMMGFDHVFDTGFAADLTIFEEATEFLGRFGEGKGVLPLMTSCCPAWVKYVEMNHPELLPNLSTCRSPQQMFGSLAKRILPGKLGIPAESLVVVSIMPCTAKKYEAGLPQYRGSDGRPDIDYVLTTTEIAKMIASMGIRFQDLEPEAFDMPFGFASGSGLIFGASGGVMEAALRYAAEVIDEPLPHDGIEFRKTDDSGHVREAEIRIGGKACRIAVVHGLAAAGHVARQIAEGKAEYDFIEFMACPGGCIAGAGQPIVREPADRLKRAQGLVKTDRTSQVRNSRDNFFVRELYAERIGCGPGGHAAHEALHTHHVDRSEVFHD